MPKGIKCGLSSIVYTSLQRRILVFQILQLAYVQVFYMSVKFSLISNFSVSQQVSPPLALCDDNKRGYRLQLPVIGS